MGTFVILGFTLLTATAVPGQEKKAAKKDEDRIRGTWTMVSGEKGGEKVPEELIKEFKLTFAAEGKFKVLAEGQEREGTYKLDAKKKPRQIDLNVDDKALEGIYVLDGNNLKLCVAKAGDRPSEFTSPGDSKVMLLVLLRSKK